MNFRFEGMVGKRGDTEGEGGVGGVGRVGGIGGEGAEEEVWLEERV